MNSVNQPKTESSDRDVYTVSRLNNETRLLLEKHYARIWVEGELSNLARPNSGHLYFSLKDQQAQIRCAMFRSRNTVINFAPENGMQVVALARVSLYAPRGDYQLIVEQLEPSGDGALQRAFNLLKAKLAQEGLFAAERKRALPELPYCIGVVTSPTGAAVRDIITTLRRRFPSIPIIIYPADVQGKQAAPSITRAIQLANQRRECDVLIVGRGGGSLEDLWAFNEESVARAIAASSIPIVAGIGHEIDFTIADFVADVRAPTPTAAAETVTPEIKHWLQQLKRQQKQLIQMMHQRLQRDNKQLQHLRKRLRHPQEKLQAMMQRLDHLQLQLWQAMQQCMQHQRFNWQSLHQRLQHCQPQYLINDAKQRLRFQAQQLLQHTQWYLQHAQQTFTQLAHRLHTISPLATLQRGYAIALTSKSHVIRDAKQVKVDDKIAIRLAKDQLDCQILAIKDVGS